MRLWRTCEWTSSGFRQGDRRTCRRHFGFDSLHHTPAALQLSATEGGTSATASGGRRTSLEVCAFIPPGAQSAFSSPIFPVVPFYCVRGSCLRALRGYGASEQSLLLLRGPRLEACAAVSELRPRVESFALYRPPPIPPDARRGSRVRRTNTIRRQCKGWRYR